MRFIKQHAESLLGLISVTIFIVCLALISHPAHAQQVNVAVKPVVTPVAAASLVLKAAPGNLYSVYAANITATAGFLIVLNATSDPTTGTVAPLACVPLPASGAASINYIPTPAGSYSVGITAVLTSANTCFQITEGTITGFIAGTVQ